ncbi:hypothetical protein D7B24_005302 [Verticillium nonalfalfae]|uniref:Major facilitator superfamily (MFS) profile domain-containing protein n=1 Tax=Verticillium nonalfalfae TaxID=1051616 RepID=A0A3M9YBT6_9PEZI|nr:uncharacterized protein D7B24_005302 [Verticillium nonalfalfae]RNJ57987.1 hypothetical protein D7B24_005302 [Verticillium nonalfalfae]
MAETQPLLGPRAEPQDPLACLDDPKPVFDFDPNGDSDNPREWPASFKRNIVALLACMAFTVTFTCISVVPVAHQIVSELDNGRPNDSASALLVTIWELGEAAGPLLIAPLSEVYGRYPVMNVCNVLFIAATVLAAVSQSSTLFIAARALTGLAVASNVLSPAIIGDIFEPDQRGSAMSLMMLAPLIGGAVGPAIGGAVAQTLGWRQVLWMSAGLAVACEILFLTCFRETYKMVILRKRAPELYRQHQLDQEPKESSDHGSLRKLWHSVTRPMSVLFSSGVLLALSLFGSISFSYFYVMSITLPDILQDIYGFSPALTGSAFITFSIGSFVAIAICNFGLDRIYIHLRAHDPEGGKPEHRLPLTIVGAFALPLAVMAYGWAAELRLPVPLLLLAAALLDGSLLLAMVPVSAYVVDAFGLYSASAMTGVIVTRCLMGTFLPLSTGPLRAHFGYGWGFTILGAVSLCLAPIPIFIMRYGATWRKASLYSRDT